MFEKYTIVIPTRNRLTELKITLENVRFLIEEKNMKCIICDDGSTDGTFDYVTKYFPKIEIFRNEDSKGIHYVRNRLLNKVNTQFALSIDDDIHFISQNPIEIIEDYFKLNPKCAIIGFRIFWSKLNPESTDTLSLDERVKSFGAGASIWRMDAWHDIPDYPEWFVFYGEEDFASFQLFKKGWEVHYVSEILVHHRVDIKARKKEKDYRLRLRRSLRSGWYLYILFYPWKLIPRKMAYTLWIQIKNKVLMGDWKAMLAIIQAMGDVIISFPKLLKNSNRLTMQEFRDYSILSDTKLYWTPKDN